MPTTGQPWCASPLISLHCTYGLSHLYSYLSDHHPAHGTRELFASEIAHSPLLLPLEPWQPRTFVAAVHGDWRTPPVDRGRCQGWPERMCAPPEWKAACQAACDAWPATPSGTSTLPAAERHPSAASSRHSAARPARQPPKHGLFPAPLLLGDSVTETRRSMNVLSQTALAHRGHQLP